MEALYILIPLSILIVFVAIAIFLKMSDSGQFDDMVGPASRILHDDDKPRAQESAAGGGSDTTVPNKYDP